ncbi:hypothetical protein LRAMOSA05238 [Lichtheimia ramosa]|uniref:Uncharacterized protein n=1 Tax=Lichtheimia ramosa TaxID=688394 RepID=A0A077X0R2_9FUNG|nr:hypothetical protein LRAMOSA05238 [Lichtheimia ramosa]
MQKVYKDAEFHSNGNIILLSHLLQRHKLVEMRFFAPILAAAIAILSVVSAEPAGPHAGGSGPDAGYAYGAGAGAGAGAGVEAGAGAGAGAEAGAGARHGPDAGYAYSAGAGAGAR